MVTSVSDNSFLDRRMSLVGMITSSVQGSIAPISRAAVTCMLRLGPPLYASQAEEAEATIARAAYMQQAK